VTFVLLFVVGMLIIPVMIDIRKHGRDNILRRSDRDLLEFKGVRFFPRFVTGLSEAFPGALSLLLACFGLMLVGLTMVQAIRVGVGIYWLGSDIFGSMSIPLHLIVILLVGSIAGWLAGQIVRGTGFGFDLIANICVGIIGALIGSWLLPRLGIHLGTGIVAAIVAAIIGAVLLLIVLRLLDRRRR
jgi:uncharacterized membrane protein YeaQ/YmgE (transglycosylase-associated protein family)